MGLKNNFKSDLEKEKKLTVLLDSYYKSNLKHYTFERITDIKQQYKGVDLIFKHMESGASFYIDEKAQLDYINEDLPTFAFELCYLKNGEEKRGWLFDEKKITNFYSLITAIYSDEPNSYTSCKITLVNRKRLIEFLLKRGIDKKSISENIFLRVKKHGKHKILGLDDKKEGYLFFSKQNKNEQPINLILRLDFLIQHKIAKRLF
ncbi:hypothetical protein MTsPCn9_15760 [Croceitalea sp. MTPC9]|uniref:hypothetical protein n=1 Tax=unclassified Croceitalea TaxID=2632280 RepID=UPI002B367E93|nr:hypothetical protein MTsPCn6_13370 [Croceitalea sp. MTPC6]GMN16640.1 hypothetical protein MTsPCn9_15760 [Croceitalea sp. MTPC9]